MQIHHKIAYYIQQNLWQSITLINILLIPLSCLYLLAHYLHYNFFQQPRKFKSKIICVGNATVGGAGKTPFVIKLCKLLSTQNKKIALVAKGYKGSLLKNNSATKVNKAKHTAEQTGDEALVLAEYATTYIAKERELAVAAAEKDGADIIIMDDGLQNNKVKKDLSILIQPNSLKNYLPLPAGPMRELLFSVLYKADIIVTDDAKTAYLKSFPRKLIIEQKQIISNAKNLNQKYILLCGIARPERVEAKLAEHNISIQEKFFFPDHYLFTDSDLNKVYEKAKTTKCKIITTSKDFIRIPDKYHKNTDVIQLDLTITSEEKLLKKICE
jgi:tetraacyldisaccharide 4'-kinase